MENDRGMGRLGSLIRDFLPTSHFCLAARASQGPRPDFGDFRPLLVEAQLRDRGTVGLLADSNSLCEVIGLEQVPHFTTLQNAVSPQSP